MHEAHRLLRQATASHHARLDAVLGGGFASRGDYAVYVRGMRDFVADADHALGGAAMTTRLREWLGEDCDALGMATHAQPHPEVARERDGAAQHDLVGREVGEREAVLLYGFHFLVHFQVKRGLRIDLADA